MQKLKNVSKHLFAAMVFILAAIGLLTPQTTYARTSNSATVASGSIGKVMINNLQK